MPNLLSLRHHLAPNGDTEALCGLMCLNPNLLEASSDEANTLDSFGGIADERTKRRAHCVLGAAGNSIRSNRARLRFSLSRRRPFWSVGQVRKLGKFRQLYSLRGS